MKRTATLFAVLTALAATSGSNALPVERRLPSDRVVAVTIDSKTIHLPVLEGSGIRFVRLKRSQGLSSQRVTSIAQDAHGFLWFATDYGVDRYDGYRFRVFASQPDSRGNPVYVGESTLFVDRSGTLWVGSDYALDRYDPVTESFGHYVLPNSSNAGSLVHHISQDRVGMLWISTEVGLYRLDPTNAKTTHFRHESADPLSLSSDDIRSSGEDREGTLWVATSEGLDAFDRDHGRVTLHVPLPETRDFGFFEDSAGVFWIRYASGNGLAILNRETQHLTRYSFGREDLPSRPLTGVSSILEDQDNTLWIGTFSDGLLKYDRVHRTFIRYRNDPTNDESLTENRITTLLQDREKNIWVGFGATEPAYFSTQPASFEVLPFDAHNPDNLGEVMVNGIYEDHEGIVWMGTTGALLRLDRKAGRFSHVVIPGHGVASDVLSTVEDTAGALWVGTSGQGLYRRLPDGKRLTTFRHSDSDPTSLSDDTVVRLLIDHAGTLWVGTASGLDRFNPATQTFTNFRPSVQGQPDTVKDLVDDSRGGLWVGTLLSGVLRFDPRSGTFVPLGGDQQRAALARPWLNSLLMDHTGSLWAGTQNGLDHIDPSSDLLAHYTEKDGLPNISVGCVLEDSAGRIWLGTGAGLSRFDPGRKIFTNYTQADGLPGLDFTGWRACFRSESGEMFMGGFAGAVAFRPEKLAASVPYTPSVALTSFQLFGKPVQLGPGSPLKRAIVDTDRLTLAPDQNSFAFEFAALSFTNPASNRYRYRLEGFDQDWTVVGSERRVANYTALLPGSYVFRIQGATLRGPWGLPGASVAIRILPPWWETWWFRTAAGLLIVLTAWLFYRLRIRQVSRQLTIRIEERLGERTRIAQELHDTVLQGLTSASLQLEVADRQIAADATAKPLVQRISQLLRQLTEESRHTVRGLRLRYSEEENLERALTQISKDLATPHKVKYQVVVEGTPRSLRPFVRDEIYRIGGEALANAFRHARASTVETVLEYGRDHFRLLVRDDGKGIDPEVLKGGREGHFGLSGLRERAAKIGAQLKIRTAAGAGTEIDLIVPTAATFERSKPHGSMSWLEKLTLRGNRP